MGERWFAASRRTARQAASGGSVFAQRCGRDEKKRRKARGRQVDQIVEPRRRPAEGRVARCAVADHTVGGVDRLVECGAREPANDHPKNRRDDRVGEILRQALDGGAGDTGGIEAGGVAADDVRDRRAAGGDAALFERARDIGDMPVQAPLGDKCAGEEPDRKNPEGQTQQRVLYNEGDHADDCEQDQQGDNSCATPRLRSRRFAIKPAFEQRDQPADPGHRMPDRALQALRITETKLDQHGDECERYRHDPLKRAMTHRCFTAAISAPPGAFFPARLNLSSTCRPGSIPIPIRSRDFRPRCWRACPMLRP